MRKPLTQPPKGGVVDDVDVNCLMLHPIGWPNHGPQIEHYLAEEAVGLVKSLGWSLQHGPMWETANQEAESEDEENEDEKSNDMYAEKMKELREIEEFGIVINQKGEAVYDPNLIIKKAREEGIKDGDYVYGPNLKGVFYKTGVIIDVEDTATDSEDEWKNLNVRESLARSCMIRTRKQSSTTFFTKGKLNEIGLFIKEN